jgi:3-dehydroquinate synthase
MTADAGKIVNVSLAGNRSYEIEIRCGLIAEIGERLREALGPGNFGKIFVVTDDNVASLYLSDVTNSLAATDSEVRSFILPPGEQTKDYSNLQFLTGELLGAGIERKDLVLALGGGVIGDLAGFAASIVLRGVGFVQVPTTLLAQVDSSVGGKTAIDTEQGKNLVGSFYQPKAVFIDTSCIDSLPRRELLAGYAEVAKYAVLGDMEFFGWLEQHGSDALNDDGATRAEMIARCCTMKADIVAEDERETGRRALLNLGHTFGHALEVTAGFEDGRLLHGEAVAIGICLAYRLAINNGDATDAEFERVENHLSEVGLATEIPRTWPDGSDAEWDANRLVEAMMSDKKVDGGRIGLVLPRGIGNAYLTHDIGAGRVEALLNEHLDR